MSLFGLQAPLIGADDTWGLLAICLIAVAFTIYLENRFSIARKITGSIIALLLALGLSNLGIIPQESGVWDMVWGYIVPLAVPLLLWNCDIKKIWKEAEQLLIIFFIGSVGTSVGAVLAYFLFGKFIPESAGLAGIFTGTYIGGTVNFVALAAAFETSEKMISASIIADNLLMVLYFFVLIMIPSISFFRRHFKHPYMDEVEKRGIDTDTKNHFGKTEMSLKDIAMSMAISVAIVCVSSYAADFFASLVQTDFGLGILIKNLLGNKYLWITSLSIGLATFGKRFCCEVKGSGEIGTFFIYIFFFVIGVPASMHMIIFNFPILLAFAACIVCINMLFSFVFGKIFGFTLEEIILASNANIGGPTTAAAMAVSRGWTGLVGPIMLIGTFGYVVGTYFGLLIGFLLGA